ncbi:hypothetical protein ARMSODRAFT_1028344 [Armillaria solidipes]|uniref:F-box domain-containing protein n=1 Tax=Armillaria solidipes TaxID=1076256 RepID=A0A2H3ANH3_9AGAR|nr:hypothetical protein ARMSODRAFT_1028344 [Armillaria solidipes]
MNFDYETLVDEPYDFLKMTAVIDNYDEALDPAQRYAQAYDGTHLYYRYQSRLLDILTDATSNQLRASLQHQYDTVRACFIKIDDTHLPYPPSPLEIASIRPIPFSDTVPIELWEEVFTFLPHQCRLVSRRVCSWWCKLLTPKTHAYLVLSLSDRWPEFRRANSRHDPLALHKFASAYELDMSSMIVSRSLRHIVRGVRYTNWPVFPYNFFLHLLDNVEVVVFEATAPLTDDFQPPAVPCPYLLPSSVKELRLSKVALDGHSIEGMLSPAGRLERLYIENIDGGHLGIPSVPFDHDYTTFRESVAITTFRRPYIRDAASPSLRYVKLDLMYDVFGAVAARYGMAEFTDDGFALLHQLFRTEFGAAYLESMLEEGEVFPLQTRTSLLEELDIRVGSQYFEHIRFVWPPLASSLTKLTLRIPRGNTGGSGTPMTLDGLDVLQTLIIHCEYQIVRRGVNVMATWGSPCRSSPESVFELWLHTDSHSPVLHLHCVSSLFLRRRLLASAKNNMRTFRGSFVFGLWSTGANSIEDIDFEIASGIVASMRDDDAIGLRRAECRRVHVSPAIP